MTTAIVGGEVVTVTGRRRAHILIDGGRIAEIRPADQRVEVDRVYDATGLIVFPGMIDPHVHFDNPGESIAADFGIGTSGAVAGGLTFVVEHPFTWPLTTTAELYSRKIAEAGSGAVTNFGLWGALAEGYLEEIPKQFALGAGGFKAYLPTNTMGWPPADEPTLREGFRIIADLGGLALVHAEDRGIVDTAANRIRASGRCDAIAAAESRPREAERTAVETTLALARETGVSLHLVHLSIRESIELVLEARDAATDVSFEITAHHLLLDQDALPAVGTLAVCSPPLRSRDDREELWNFVENGLSDALVSDHCPYERDDKERQVMSIDEIPQGIQSIQEFIPLLYSEAVVRRGMDPCDFAKLTSEFSAKRLGLFPRKGTISPGADADLTLIDPSAIWAIDVSRQFASSPWSPYRDWNVTGQIAATFVGGTLAYEDGHVLAHPGSGRFVPLRPVPIRHGQLQNLGATA